MAITQKQAVQGLAALMFGQAVGTATAARFAEILENDPSIYNLANGLSATAAFNSQFRGNATTQDKIDVILGRLNLEEGSDSYETANAFVNARLEAGVPAGQIIAEIGEKLLGDSIPRGFTDASQVLVDAVERSNAYLEAGNEGNTSLQLNGPVPTLLLAQALEQINVATEARVEFLQEAAEVEAIATILSGTDFDAEATAAAIETNLDNNIATMAATTGVTDFGERDDATQNALISEAVSRGERAVTAAQNNVANGVVAALDTVETRVTALEQAINAFNAAEELSNAQLASFNSLNANNQASIDLDAGTITITTVNDGDVVVAEQQPSGAFRLANQTDVTTADLRGFDALLNAVNNTGRAEVANANAETALNNALLQVAELQGDDVDADDYDLDDFATFANTPNEDGSASVDVTFDATDGSNSAPVAALISAREGLEDINENVANFQEARELGNQLESLDLAIDNAGEEVTEGYGFNLQVIGQTGFDGSAADTDDLFVFADAVGTSSAVTIDNLGDEGNDYLYFGEGYAAVALGNGAITDRVGSSSALEIFWQQDGDNLVLYVEADATSGNGIDASDVTQITLTGVNVQDVDYSNGFLSVNSAA